MVQWPQPGIRMETLGEAINSEEGGLMVTSLILRLEHGVYS